MNNKQEIQELKDALDIIDIAKIYGALKKSGANYTYVDDTSIVFNATKQIFSNFNGDITGGSVLDLIMYMEKIDLKSGIKRLKELCGQENYTSNKTYQVTKKERKPPPPIDIQQIRYFGKQELEKGNSKSRYITFTKEGNTTHVEFLDDKYSKFFETNKIESTYLTRLDYILKEIIGFSEFFDTLSIILKDDDDKIIDTIAYRPNKPKDNKKYPNEQWSSPKYLAKNSKREKGKFLYAFRKEVERMLKKQTKNKYLIVGEGIKNGVNALLYGVPFISIESTSYNISDKLKKYIIDYYERGYGVLCMFDGDKAGEKAYKKFIKNIGLDLKNFLDFTSGLDFVDYLQKEDTK